MDAKHLYEVAYRCYTSGKYEEAEKFFRLLTTADTKNTHYWMGLGAALQVQEKYNDAIESFSAAAIMDDEEKNPFPHLYAAECLLSIGELPRAELALKSALNIAEKDEKHQSVIQKVKFLHERWMKYAH